ncbi:hypothetical protein K505DRAFT_369196 [Melanomma pulvis-pyrius CBS 109.77]|uniref:AAA domain-containing protein n=1 Tax=Melanomma pulvis-pyrius CBS 109.77 TaxID=1314802 RepID=A0A6A6WNH0_9PLEO|nr:hypothetical protein K505DRAFT_369196 [Melanomma pulvis-pyrius CBS 109.77]
MEDHEPCRDDVWNPRCDYICKRETLVTSIIKNTRDYGVMVIRAPPQVGKSTLLKLIGHHIAHNEPDLDPVYFVWKSREDRQHIPYQQYIQQEQADWQQKEPKIPPRNPTAQMIYLIDEAQNSYEEEILWENLKNRKNTRTSPYYVLVCVYGAAGISSKRDPRVESQAQLMHRMHLVELRPSFPGNPYMLFQKEEVKVIVNKFAIDQGHAVDEEVVEYLLG